MLAALAAVVAGRDGRITMFSVAEATWIATIRQARPDLPPWDAWFLARNVVARESHNDPTDDLDLFLAFAPWRDDESRDGYIAAAKAAQIPQAPLFVHQMIISGRYYWQSADGGKGEPVIGSLAYLAETASPSARRHPKRGWD